jgi:DNA polymerase I-like protein with 3'-5' exonuclease and polymerase domains
MQISQGEAQRIRNAYFNAYPGIFKYHNMIKQQLNKDRTLTNLFGRRYTFLGRYDYRLFNEAYAFIPQSTIADTINRWGLRHIYRNHPEVVLLNQVHDSVVFEISKEHGYMKHAEIIMDICDSLSQPMEWHGREFIIPCELLILPKNLMEGPELEIDEELCQTELAKTIKKTVKSQLG